MKARILLGTALLALLAVAGSFSVVWFTRPTHRINRVSFGQMKQGMTKDEVEALLGCPPGDFGTAPLAVRQTAGALTPLDEIKSWYAAVTPLVHIWAGDDVQFLFN